MASNYNAADPAPPTHTRRQSFRHAHSELPAALLERLETKRRQLDDSIHRYIAQKEREYKAYEKELRHEHKPTHDREATAVRRRALSDSTFDTTDAQEQTAVDALLSTVGRRGSPVLAARDGSRASPRRDASTETMKGRRESQRRDKDLIGLFTPGYLPALDAKLEAIGPRTASEPPARHGKDTIRASLGVHRANSDSIVEAQARSPNRLQLASRTSSAASSLNGKLTPVLKLAGQSSRQRPEKRKRVSLAVGDAIVAPSDSVPAESGYSTIASHSRTRVSVAEKVVAVRDFQMPPASKKAVDGIAGLVAQANANDRKSDSVSAARAALGKAMGTSSPPRQGMKSPPAKSDPDGDLNFDLDQGSYEEDDTTNASGPAYPSSMDDEEIAGRVSFDSPGALPSPIVSYESSEGLTPLSEAQIAQTEEEEFSDEDGIIDYDPSSAVQPTEPGFRRPSVSYDPTYVIADYAQEERSAVEDEVYGSSYSRPQSKSSFTAGSVGESLMDRFYTQRHGSGGSGGGGGDSSEGTGTPGPGRS